MSTPIDPPSKGTVYCLLSATCYSGTNICLRQLAEIEADPAWVICLKETTATHHTKSTPTQGGCY